MKKGILFILFLLLINTNALKADDTGAPLAFKKTAETWASENFSGRLGNGTPFYNSRDELYAWAFVVNKENQPAPDKHELRRIVEADCEQYLALTSGAASWQKGAIPSIQAKVDQYQERIVKSPEYATVYVFGSETGPFVGMSHQGLPLYVTAWMGLEQRATSLLATESPREGKYYFLGFHDIYMGFTDEDKGVFINMQDNRLSVPAQLFAEMLHSSRLGEITVRSARDDDNTDAKEISNIIEKVPVYKSTLNPIMTFSKGCVPVSIAMVLGYWNDHGYTKLIKNEQDQGYDIPSEYPGSIGPGGDGYLYLINDELYPASGNQYRKAWSLETGKQACDSVCNDFKFEKYYDFSNTLHDFYITYDVDDSWGPYCTEIDSGYPFCHEVFNLSGDT